MRTVIPWGLLSNMEPIPDLDRFVAVQYSGQKADSKDYRTERMGDNEYREPG